MLSAMKIVGLVLLFVASFVFGLLVYLGGQCAERVREKVAICIRGRFVGNNDEEHCLQSIEDLKANPTKQRRDFVESLDLISDGDDTSFADQNDLLIDNMDVMRLFSGTSQQEPATTSGPYTSLSYSVGSLLSKASNPSKNQIVDEKSAQLRSKYELDDDIEQQLHDVVPVTVPGETSTTRAQQFVPCPILNHTTSPVASSSFLVGSVRNEIVQTQKPFSRDRVLI